MELGINSLFLLPFEFEDGLRFAQKQGIKVIEMACLGEASRKFCDPSQLIGDNQKLKKWLGTLEKYDLKISAFSAHGNGLSPDKEISEAYAQHFRKICELAELAGVKILTLNAGIPAGAPGDKCPCWVVDPTNAKNRSILRWQWEERVIPFWKEQARIAEDHGCRLAFEPWIGDIVHSPMTLMKLREAIGPIVGCNLDPSHLFVQKIDVLETIAYLGELLLHVHIKDTRMESRNLKLQGLLDTTQTPATPEKRSWTFTLVGWGHDQKFWRDFITTLRFIGYEGALSVEMECDYIGVQEGLEKSIDFFKPLLMEKPPSKGKSWWEIAGFHQIAED